MMKVQFCKTVEVESEVHITSEDITEALQEMLRDAEQRMNPGTTERQKAFAVQQFVSSIHSCLAAVTSEMIAQIKPQHRELISNALLGQADRFSSVAFLKQIDELSETVMLLQNETVALAKLAATEPAFCDPFEAVVAKSIRDRILQDKCGLNPDGSAIRKDGAA
jgi:hypothetical protein